MGQNNTKWQALTIIVIVFDFGCGGCGGCGSSGGACDACGG